MKDEEIDQICAGSCHSMILKRTGEVLVFGWFAFILGPPFTLSVHPSFSFL